MCVRFFIPQIQNLKNVFCCWKHIHRMFRWEHRGEKGSVLIQFKCAMERNRLSELMMTYANLVTQTSAAGETLNSCRWKHQRWGEHGNFPLINLNNKLCVFPVTKRSIMFPLLRVSFVWGLIGALLNEVLFFCSGATAPVWRISTTCCLSDSVN